MDNIMYYIKTHISMVLGDYIYQNAITWWPLLKLNNRTLWSSLIVHFKQQYGPSLVKLGSLFSKALAVVKKEALAG